MVNEVYCPSCKSFVMATVLAEYHKTRTPVRCPNCKCILDCVNNKCVESTFPLNEFIIPSYYKPKNYYTPNICINSIEIEQETALKPTQNNITTNADADAPVTGKIDEIFNVVFTVLVIVSATCIELGILYAVWREAYSEMNSVFLFFAIAASIIAILFFTGTFDDIINTYHEDGLLFAIGSVFESLLISAIGGSIISIMISFFVYMCKI